MFVKDCGLKIIEQAVFPVLNRLGKSFLQRDFRKLRLDSSVGICRRDCYTFRCKDGYFVGCRHTFLSRFAFRTFKNFISRVLTIIKTRDWIFRKHFSPALAYHRTVVDEECTVASKTGSISRKLLFCKIQRTESVKHLECKRRIRRASA